MRSGAAIYGKERWFDAGRTVIHEFGHAFGIDDLGHRHGGIMGSTLIYKTIKNDDLSYVKVLYYPHTHP